MTFAGMPGRLVYQIRLALWRLGALKQDLIVTEVNLKTKTITVTGEFSPEARR